MLSAIVKSKGLEVDYRWHDVIIGEKTEEEINNTQAEECVKTLRANFYGKEDNE